MNLKEKQGREAILESAEQVFMALKEVRHFGDMMAISKHMKNLPEDFDLDGNVNEVIKGLQDVEDQAFWAQRFEQAMSVAGNDASIYGEWSLDELDEKVEEAMVALAKTLLGVSAASEQDVDLLVKNLEAKARREKENSKLADNVQAVADSINNVSGSVAILAEKVEAEN